VTRDAPTVFVV